MTTAGVTDTLDRLTNALAGRCWLERELGAGGMATVYLARDLRHKRDVAVEVLDVKVAETPMGGRVLEQVGP